jgi:Nucleotide modification associated domain 2
MVACPTQEASLRMKLYSYVVRYDSGFAPNPFYGWCTLATCKGPIRKEARVGDWVVGTGSGDKKVRRGKNLVYIMRVTDVMTFEEYNADTRFESKKPYRIGSRKQSCGDNIYFRNALNTQWYQRDSFHTNADGSRNANHVKRDTKVNRVLASNEFVYFGGIGPRIPSTLVAPDGSSLCKKGPGYRLFDDPAFIAKVQNWITSLGDPGYQGPPFEWISLRE